MGAIYKDCHVLTKLAHVIDLYWKLPAAPSGRRSFMLADSTEESGIGMKYILVTYLKPLWAHITAGLIIKLLASVAELFLPFVLAYIIDTVIPAKDQAAVYVWGAVMLVLSFAGLLFNVIANRHAAKLGSDATEKMRGDLFVKSLQLSCAQMNELTKPSVMTRLTTDTYNIHQMIVRIQRLGVRAPILFVGSLVLTMTLDFRLAAVLLATIPFISAIIWFVTKKSIPMYAHLQNALDKAVRMIREDIAGIRVIKALSKTDVENDRFGTVNEEITGREIAVNKTLAFLEPAANLLLNFGLAAVVAVGASLVNRDLSEIGKIVAFTTYFTLIMQALMSITRIFDLVSRAVASAARITDVLTTDTGLTYENADAPSQDPYSIEFKDVSFSYNDGEYVLKDITFRLRKGETLGIIGETGSGKSTLVNLLLRFYDAEVGAIYLDGESIKAIPMEALRAKFGVVLQNEPLFEESVRHNIVLGRPVTPEQLRCAVGSSGTAEFIGSLEESGSAQDALEKKLDIKGANLSGGQKQRVLIARALAARPEILILDDSSSALDYKTDAFVRKKLKENYGDVTTIIIAQRISSIRSADNILVLENGSIIGTGTHDDLMASCTAYQEIWQSQMGGV
jgi:ATP-binding cassette subfamily B protein